MVVEGLTTAPVLRDLSRRLGIELPITEGVCAVLEGTLADGARRPADGPQADVRVVGHGLSFTVTRLDVI